MNTKVTSIIDTYIKYNTLSDNDIKTLLKFKIINWLWWEWAYLKNIALSLANLPYFDTAKSKKLVEDIEYKYSYRHDLAYVIWKTYIDFTIANIRLALWIFSLTWWTKWYERLWLTLSVFAFTQTIWKQYFNWEWYESDAQKV